MINLRRRDLVALAPALTDSGPEREREQDAGRSDNAKTKHKPSSHIETHPVREAFRSATALDLRDNPRLMDVSGVGQLLGESLQRLDLSGCVSLGQAKKKSSKSGGDSLDDFNGSTAIESAQLPSFPLPLSDTHLLAALRELRLVRCGLTGALSANLNGLHALEILDVSQNDLIGTQKGAFDDLPELRELRLSRNKLAGRLFGDDLVALGKSRHLAKLFVEHNDLLELPPPNAKVWSAVGRSLSTFDCSDNYLSSLQPEAFRQLGALEKLMVDYNELSSLNSGLLQHLPKLREFSIRGNKLQQLPATFVKFVERLTLLDLAENSFASGHPVNAIGTDDMDEFVAALAALPDVDLPLPTDDMSAGSRIPRRELRRQNTERLAREGQTAQKKEGSIPAVSDIRSRISQWELGQFSLRSSVSGDTPVTSSTVQNDFINPEPKFELFRFRGSTSVNISLVPPVFAALSSNDCVVLDRGGDGVFVWLGERADIHKKRKAGRFARVLLDEEYLGRSEMLHVLSESSESPEFLEALGATKETHRLPTLSVRDCRKLDSESDAFNLFGPRLFRFSEPEPGNLEISAWVATAESPLTKSLLDSSSAFVLDGCGGTRVFVWSGIYATNSERSWALLKAEELLANPGREQQWIADAPGASVARMQRDPVWVVDGAEPWLFREQFSDWRDTSWDTPDKFLLTPSNSNEVVLTKSEWMALLFSGEWLTGIQDSGPRKNKRLPKPRKLLVTLLQVPTDLRAVVGEYLFAIYKSENDIPCSVDDLSAVLAEIAVEEAHFAALMSELTNDEFHHLQLSRKKQKANRAVFGPISFSRSSVQIFEPEDIAEIPRVDKALYPHVFVVSSVRDTISKFSIQRCCVLSANLSVMYFWINLILGCRAEHEEEEAEVQTESERTEIFGRQLAEVMSRNANINEFMPDAIADACMFITDPANVIAEGLFRLSAAHDTVTALCAHVNRGGKIEWRHEAKHGRLTVHDATAFVKKYLRDLPLPVFPDSVSRKLLDDFAQFGSDSQHAVRVAEILKCDMSEVHARFMRALAAVARIVASHADQNRMTPHNLALIFAPTLLANVGNDLNMDEITSATLVTKLCLFQPETFAWLGIDGGKDFITGTTDGDIQGFGQVDFEKQRTEEGKTADYVQEQPGLVAPKVKPKSLRSVRSVRRKFLQRAEHTEDETVSTLDVIACEDAKFANRADELPVSDAPLDELHEFAATSVSELEVASLSRSMPAKHAETNKFGSSATDVHSEKAFSPLEEGAAAISARPATTEQASSRTRSRRPEKEVISAKAIFHVESSKCNLCDKIVYHQERLALEGRVFHKSCFVCEECGQTMSLGTYASLNEKYYHKPCFKRLFLSKGNYSEGFGEAKPQQGFELRKIQQRDNLDNGSSSSNIQAAHQEKTSEPKLDDTHVPSTSIDKVQSDATTVTSVLPTSVDRQLLRGPERAPGVSGRRRATRNVVRARSERKPSNGATATISSEQSAERASALVAQLGGQGLLYAVAREPQVALKPTNVARLSDQANSFRMVKVRGRRSTFARQVQCWPASFTPSDVFLVFDSDKKSPFNEFVFQVNGPRANRIVKGRAMDLAKNIKDKDLAGIPIVNVIETATTKTSSKNVIALANFLVISEHREHGSGGELPPAGAKLQQAAMELATSLVSKWKTWARSPTATDQEDVALDEKLYWDTVRLYECRVDDDGKNIITTEVGRGRGLSKEILNDDSCYLLDAFSEVYVWPGRRVDRHHRAAVLRYSESLWVERAEQTDQWIAPFRREFPGAEGVLFKEHFADWGSGPPIQVQTAATGVRVAGAIGSIPIADIAKRIFEKTRGLDGADAAAAVVASERARMLAEGKLVLSSFAEDRQPGDSESVMPDIPDGTNPLKIWRIDTSSEAKSNDEQRLPRVPISQDEFGEFYSGETYVVLYTHTWRNKDAHIIYFWQGRDATIIDKGTSAALAVEHDRVLNGMAREVRVVQHREPKHFCMIFHAHAGRFIIHQGRRQATSRQWHDVPTSLRLFVFHRRQENKDDIEDNAWSARTVEVDPVVSSLASTRCYVLLDPKHTVLWFGTSTSTDLRDQARLWMTARNDANAFTEFVEGTESPFFWHLFGINADITDTATWRPLQGLTRTLRPRLFSCSVGTGRFEASEVFPFQQDDLEQENVFILDCDRPISDSSTQEVIFVWIGSRSTSRELKLSLELASAYARLGAFSRSSTEEPVLWCVRSGAEPLQFASLFDSWNWSRRSQVGRGSPVEAGKAEATFAGRIGQPRAEFFRFATSSEYPRLHAQLWTQLDDPSFVVCSSETAVESGTRLLQEYSRIFSYRELVARQFPIGIDPLRLETYMSDAEFVEVFGISSENFSKLPPWRQEKLKREKHLY